jgi:hypothetical protein
LLRKLFLLNIFIIFLIGFFGNLITIATIINAKQNHPMELAIFSHSLTPLLIHLGICDILYCANGLPSFAVTFHAGYFPFPEFSCKLVAIARYEMERRMLIAPSSIFYCRNVIVYTDFITLGNMMKNFKFSLILPIQACYH